MLAAMIIGVHTVAVSVGHDDVSRAELGEKLLDELQRRVGQDSERGLIHVRREVERIDVATIQRPGFKR